MLLEFRRLIREAEVEYVSSGTASDLTGWDGGTLRKYARKSLAGDPMPELWSRLVVRREGKEYAFVLSTIPAKAFRAEKTNSEDRYGPTRGAGATAERRQRHRLVE